MNVCYSQPVQPIDATQALIVSAGVSHNGDRPTVYRIHGTNQPQTIGHAGRWLLRD